MLKTIKIVGVPGVGKSTLIAKLLKINPKFKSANYADFLQRASDLTRDQLYLSAPANYRLADKLFKKFLKRYKRRNILILIDEHLEIGDWQKLTRAYREENTIGIIFLIADPREILNRRGKDKTRYRPIQSLQEIKQSQQKIKHTVEQLAQKLKIPLFVLENKNLKETVRFALCFIRQITGG
ncbi:MAG: AAA family ATPase [Patescibacteria group bacterium]